MLLTEDRVPDLVGRHQFVAYEGDVEYAEDSETGLLVPANPVVYESPVYKNLIVDTGKAAYLDRLAGINGPPAAFAHIGVGSGTDAVAVGQTRLNIGGTGSALLKACDATFPSRSGLVLTYRATFGTAEANFTWNEAGIFNGTVNGTSIMFNRVIIGPFGKSSSVSIVYTTTITQS